VEAVKTRQDKHVRFFGDCAGLLFKNRHFEECLMLEGWGQEKPFFGSYLCGYEKRLFVDTPHQNYKRSILEVKHDIVVDADEEYRNNSNRFAFHSQDNFKYAERQGLVDE
jgi:hypothetical protein